MDRDNFVIQLILRARDDMAGAMQSASRNLRGFRGDLNRAQGDMRSFDRQAQSTERRVSALGNSVGKLRGAFNSIRGPTDGAGRSVRRLGVDMNNVSRTLERVNRHINTNRESIAKFDNEIRGMRVLIIAAQMQALASAVLGLGGALTSVAGSAISAGAALGGALTAGAAQAIPAIGLLASTLVRLKQVFDVVQQVQDAQKAQATQATSAGNAQADSLDKVKTASEGVRDATQRVREAQLGVAEAYRQARKDRVDLTLAQRSARLQEEESEDRLRQLRSQGTTGFELRGAELDVDESRVRSTRASQELRQTRTGTPEGVRTALTQLRDAQEALQRSRRGMQNARRDAAEGTAGTVAAARQLDFMQAQLSGAERRLVRSILRLRETWKEVSRPITDTIVGAFTNAVDRAEEVIRRPSLRQAFQRLANETADQMDRLTRSLTSDRSIAFFERSTRRLANNLQPATTAAIRLSRAFQNIADAAAPTLHRLIQDFAHFTGRIENFTADQGRMRGIFEFGEQQLHGWLRLAEAIAETIAAIIAPGGDLQSGAASSGLRNLNFLTLQFRQATEWINSHPLQVDEFFGDSEVIFRRLFELLVNIGKIIFEIFDPGSVDAFADIIEGLLPAFQMVAQVFGAFSRAFAELLQIPGIRQIIQGAFGFLLLQRIGSKFVGLFYSIAGALLGGATSVGKMSAFMTTLVGTSGGLVTRIRAATVAMNAFGASAERAAVATRATTVLPAGQGAGGVYRDPKTGRQTLPPAVVAGRGGGRLAGLRGIAGTVGGAVGLTALIGGIIGAISSPDGSVAGRLQNAGSVATFGALRGPTGRDFNDVGRTAQVQAFAKAIRGLAEERNIRGLHNLREQLEHANLPRGAENRLKDLLDQVTRVTQAKVTLRNLFPREDISNLPLFKQAIDRIQDLRDKGINSIKQLRDNMRITFNFIGQSAEKGSNAWRVAMISNTQAGVDGLLKAANQGKIGWRDAMEEITRISRRQMRLVKGHITTLSGEARDALSNNFRTARIRAERQLGHLEDATGKSLAFLKRLMANELASYGFTSTEVRRIIRAKQDPDEFGRGSRQTEGTSQGPLKATGGWVQRPMGGFVGAMGERGQDAIRTILGRGEAVLNWGQQKFVEPALNAAYGFGLDELFNRTRGYHGGGQGQTGYAAGGRIPIVPVPGFPGERANRAILDEIAFVTKRFGLRLTDAYGQGHQSPGHTVYGTAADFSGPDRSMNAAVRFLARRYKVLYDGRFGSMSYPGHGPSTVAGSNAHLHVEFGTKDLAAAAGNARPFRIPRVEITGAGAMGDIATAGIAQVRRGAIRAARRAIERTLLAGTEGSEVGAGAAPPGQLRSWLRRALSITKHLTPGNLSALYGRAMQESGGNPRAQNNWDSNAAAGIPSKGLLQTIPPTFAAYSLPGMKDIWNPVHNAVAAIRYMYANYGHIVGPSSTGYAKGGELPGPLGAARMIMAHGKEWIINERQKGRLSALTGMGVGALKGALGFSGGPGSFQGGGEVNRDFELPDLLPQTPGGTIGLIRRLTKFIRKFGNVNSNLDILTRENGLFDLFTTNLEAFTAKLEADVTRGTFKLKNGKAVRAHSELWVSNQTLDNLEDTGRLLRRMGNSLGRSIATVNRSIRRILRGGVDDDERDDLLDLRGQRRNLRGRIEDVRGLRGENLQSRFQEQQNRRELLLTRFTNRLGRSDAGFERGRTAIDIQERLLAAAGATGIVGRAGLFAARGANISGQIAALTGFRDRAAGRGFTEQVDELNDRLADLNVQLAENTRALFDARVEDVNRQQALVAGTTGARSRIAELQATLGLITPEESIARRREQAQIALNALISQGSSLGTLLGEATGLGDQQRVDELNQAILDNTVAQLEATVSIRELDGTLNQTQSFSSTAWQWLRTAIFNGSGGLLPQYSLPGGMTTVAGMQTQGIVPAGVNGAGGGMIVQGNLLEINEAGQVPDPTYLSNRLGWALNTPA